MRSAFIREARLLRLRARFHEEGLWCEWKEDDGASMLMWALQTLPEELWTQNGMCPAERVMMLASTSKQVRELLGQLQRRFQVSVRVTTRASMETVVIGLPRLFAWCSVVELDFGSRVKGVGGDGLADAQRAGSCSTTGHMAPWFQRRNAGFSAETLHRARAARSINMGVEVTHEGARSLAAVLGQCSSLATLNLRGNMIKAQGARSLASVLGQCSSLATLDLGGNDIRAEGARSLAGALQQCSSLAMLDLGGNNIRAEGARGLALVLGKWSLLATLDLCSNGIGDEGARGLAAVLQQCSSLATLNLAFNGIGCEGARSLAAVLGKCSSLTTLNLGHNCIGCEGVRSLAAALEQCSSLVTLELGGNNMGAEGEKIALSLAHMCKFRRSSRGTARIC